MWSICIPRAKGRIRTGATSSSAKYVLVGLCGSSVTWATGTSAWPLPRKHATRLTFRPVAAWTVGFCLYIDPDVLTIFWKENYRFDISWFPLDYWQMLHYNVRSKLFNFHFSFLTNNTYPNNIALHRPHVFHDWAEKRRCVSSAEPVWLDVRSRFVSLPASHNVTFENIHDFHELQQN